ncbi:delta(3,5)-Delta(2,4)-dienoyl-CoA isomerase [Cryptococcus deuterogattii CA1014]|nr:delta(3,5)-Delta(2,4)-dienoyl-CoA isomerase [Cryptococcus deuterogattii CA1014]
MPPLHTTSQPAPGVLLLQFNSMWTQLAHIVHRTSADPDIRAVVLSSTSDTAFTAGLDLKSQSILTRTADPARQALTLHSHLLSFQSAISSLSACRQPVICALHGFALGLAIDIAAACDIRLCASDTKFAIAEVNVGLAADIGTLQRLPKVTGNDSKVRELALMGRDFGAREAEEIGFVSEVVNGGRAQVVAAAIEKAKVIASKSPIAVISTKHILNHARDHTVSASESVEQGLQYVAAWNMQDTAKAMSATLNKEPATFPGFSDAKL